MQRMTRVTATFTLPTKNPVRDTLDVVVEKVTPAMVHGRLGSMPVAFRRLDGWQMLTDRKGNAVRGGWRIDPAKLVESAGTP